MKINANKPWWHTALPYIILAAFFLLAPIGFKSRTWLNTFVTIFVYVVASVGLRTISLSGNLSFAQAAFIGIGAYTAGILSKSLGFGIILTVPLGAVAATIIGFITGWPFARLRSMYFTMASMFLGVGIVQFISAFPLFGGAIGLTGIPSLSKAVSQTMSGPLGRFLESVGIGNLQQCYFLFLIVTIVSVALMYRFEHSRIGWTLKALSQSPAVASSIGINERYYRLLSVCVGCFFAGLIGALFAHYNTSATPNSYSMSVALWLLMYMMIGGSNNFLGPIVGALIIGLLRQIPLLLTGMSGGAGVSQGFVAFSRWVGQYSAYTPFLTALVLLLVSYFLPTGFVGIPAAIRRKTAARRERKAALNPAEGGEGHAA